MSQWLLLEKYWKEKYMNKDQLHPIYRKEILHTHHKKKIKQIEVTGNKQRMEKSEDGTIFFYTLHFKILIQDKDNYYHEEEVQSRKATIKNQKISDVKIKTPQPINNRIKGDPVQSGQQFKRFSYDRRAAVQYAERWWNDANPAYKYFEDNDCTNYISQCLRAGGAQMQGAPNRSKGWWYNHNNWSYSWSVANALRWFLSGSTSGLKGEELSEPTQLLPGDIICYDFEGDNKWDHNTIVVSKDDSDMPLVNAHTNNSRHRYWTYEDSAAWTPNCKYLFFRIGE